MRLFLKIFFYFLSSLLIGLLVAPWVYQVLQWLPVGSWGSWAEGLHSIQQMPFYRYATRSVEVTAIVFLIPFLRWLKIEQWQELFPWKSKGALRQFGVGVLIAGVPLLILELLWLKRGVLVWNEQFQIGFLGRVLVTAVTVAFLEEFLFRGFLLQLLCWVMQKGGGKEKKKVFWGPLLWSALFFALIHFAGVPHALLTDHTVHWWSGLLLLGELGKGLLPAPLFVGALCSLFVVGIFLAWVTLKTRSLALAVGLHTGWIVAQQSINALTHFSASSELSYWPWVAPAQVHGMVPVGLWVVFPFCVTFFLLQGVFGTGWLNPKVRRR